MKREYIFIFCVLVRLFLALLAKYASNTILQLMALFFFITSIGFLYQYLYRPNKLGAFGGQPWWNNLRPLHSLLYFLFAFLVFTNNGSISWLVLLLDVCIGITAFSFHYFL